MILDLGDRRERDLHNLAVGAFNLHTGSREGLSGFHTANCAPHSLAVQRDNFHVVFTVERLQCGECFGYFHKLVLRGLIDEWNFAL